MPGLEFLFHPKSIAVVGAPSDPANLAGGAIFITALLDSGYGGRIYPVNPRASRIMGLKSYPDMLSIPGAVDYVICCIPASGVERLIEEASAKGARGMTMFTAGFSEAEGHDSSAERRVAALARARGMRLLGPNCMGIHCPATGLSFQPGHSREPGPVAFLCQSGGNANIFKFKGEDRGLRFSKVISYGNAADINETELLEYCTRDPDTRIIAAYIEGTRGGPRFFEALAAARAAKPVVILKTGLTESGRRAARSHTGSLAGAAGVWDGLCRQAGAMQAHSLEQMLDIIEAALLLKPALGLRTGIIGWGGGASVLGTEACERNGLAVPLFSRELRERLAVFPFGPGTSAGNPVDSAVITMPSLFVEAMATIAGSGEVDLLLVQLPLDVSHVLGPSSVWQAAEDAILENSRQLSIPVAVVRPRTMHPGSAAFFHSFHLRCAKAGLPLYSTFGEAAAAVRAWAGYSLGRGAGSRGPQR